LKGEKKFSSRGGRGERKLARNLRESILTPRRGEEQQRKQRRVKK